MFSFGRGYLENRLSFLLANRLQSYKSTSPTNGKPKENCQPGAEKPSDKYPSNGCRGIFPVVAALIIFSGSLELERGNSEPQRPEAPQGPRRAEVNGPSKSRQELVQEFELVVGDEAGQDGRHSLRRRRHRFRRRRRRLLQRRQQPHRHDQASDHHDDLQPQFPQVRVNTDALRNLVLSLVRQLNLFCYDGAAEPGSFKPVPISLGLPIFIEMGQLCSY